jgi:dolichol-phosphate mannosyltransferase
MSLNQNLQEMEWGRERYWQKHPVTSELKLRWRALTVRHCFHLLPGESILELGAGSGLWTEHLAVTVRGENPITAAVFNDDLFEIACQRHLPNTKFLRVVDPFTDLPVEHFDYVIGTAILCHDQYVHNLRALYRVLKPGGQFLFFEANFWNPQVFVKHAFPSIGRWAGNVRCQIGLRKYKLMQMASQEQFTNIDIIPYDIVHPLIPLSMVRPLQSLAFILEHTPGVRELCGTLYIWASKPGVPDRNRTSVDLAVHPQLFGSTSIILPCYNEEMNVAPLVDALVRLYDNYIHEIIVVNDNSTDRTAEITREVARREPRVKLLDRQPPNGVGRALRDGYAAATGRYILSMDSDFLQIVPELRDLFEVIADGHDGAIGSRFSYESILINYPFLKIMCNRTFHLLVSLMLRAGVRDISNNLKLYRTDILKDLEIREPHFAANVETGLKPLLSGHDIREVPISWINRSIDMGRSSFTILKVAPGYCMALLRIIWNTWRGRHRVDARGRQVPVSCPHVGMSAASELPDISPACPVCESRDGDVTVWVAGNMADHSPSTLGPSRSDLSHGTILRCRVCQLGFLKHSPEPEELSHLYSSLPGEMYESEAQGRLQTARRHLRILHRYARPGRLLDVGCASGIFLTVAAEQGWDVVGVEPSEALCRHAALALDGRGYVICATLQEAAPSLPSCNAITLWDVLEHVPQPVAFLESCCALVKPGGHIIANVPDLDSLPARVFGTRWPLLLPEHLTYFNRRSLSACGERAGLTCLAFGRRPASFSLGYVLHRLSQHGIPGVSTVARLTKASTLDRVTVSVPIGELYVVWRR